MESTADPGDLAMIFLKNYERPANMKQPRRVNNARYWFEHLGGCDVMSVDVTSGVLEEEDEMKCIYEIKDSGGPLYYFDGRNIHALKHPDDIFILNMIYRKCTGKDIPRLTFEQNAPWWIRLQEANRNTVFQGNEK